MSTLIADDPTFVVIVQYSVSPADMQALIADIAAQAQGWISQCPGFISVNFHASDDGQRMVNYAQWRSRADWEAFTRHPEQRRLGKAIHAAGAEMFEAREYHLVCSVFAD